MKASRDAKVAEAVSRLKMMGVSRETIETLIKDGSVYVSVEPNGTLHDLTDQQKEILRQWEKRRNALVYMVVQSETAWGVLDAYIYVTDDPEMWECEKDDLKDGAALAYVYNHTNPKLSEVGYIGWRKSHSGGILRTY